MAGNHFVVPDETIERLKNRRELSQSTREALERTLVTDQILRRIRKFKTDALRKSRPRRGAAPVVPLAPAPSVQVFDCKNTTSLPGTPVPDPGNSVDITARRAFETTTAVVEFYAQCFGRNSIDGQGGALLSSIHYDVDYANAFWDGTQMVYGDGDGELFLDFTASNDVVAHELTHGVTERTAGFVYTNEPGALNESMSDVFGSMFRQWQAGQDVAAADWLIGSEIMGPEATQLGYTCLRSLAEPGAAHAMAPQPDHFDDFVSGGDPHLNSGIPNHAFYRAAMTLGGWNWEKLGLVWYAALTGGRARPNTRIKTFGNLTREAARSLFPDEPEVYAAVDAGWTAVGL